VPTTEAFGLTLDQVGPSQCRPATPASFDLWRAIHEDADSSQGDLAAGRSTPPERGRRVVLPCAGRRSAPCATRDRNGIDRVNRSVSTTDVGILLRWGNGHACAACRHLLGRQNAYAACGPPSPKRSLPAQASLGGQNRRRMFILLLVAAGRVSTILPRFASSALR